MKDIKVTWKKKRRGEGPRGANRTLAGVRDGTFGDRHFTPRPYFTHSV